MANLYLLYKGDKVGHAFRGNQWTGAGHKFTAAQKKVIKDCNIPPSYTNVQVALNPNAITKARAWNPVANAWIPFRTKEGAAKSTANIHVRGKDFHKAALAISTKAQNDMMNKKLSEKQRDAACVIALTSVCAIRHGTTSDGKATAARTLQMGDAVVTGTKVKLDFMGKSGQRNVYHIDNANIAKYISERKAQMTAERRRGQLFNISATYSDAYFKSIGGDGFKVKDFRTWHANIEARKVVSSIKRAPKDVKSYKAAVKKVAIAVSKKLNNTPAMALKSYIDPAVFAGWELTK